MTTLSTPIDYFKKEAKKLFRQVQANDAEALARVQRVLKDATAVSLMRVQHVIAVEYGFPKWEDLIRANPVELHLAITMEKEPLLNDFGIGIYDGHRRLSKEERDAIFKKDRKVLRESVNAIAKTIVWLQARVTPIKTINNNQSSYRYKHLAEKDIGYITNGVFIAAAIIAGYPYKIANDGPNVLFGMSEKSIKETEKLHQSRSRGPNPTGTPLGNFFRGPGIIPTPPHLAALADMFDSMTMEEQRRYLDEDVRAMGLFRTHYKCAKESEFEVCPRCAVKSYSVHDRRWVNVQDQPIRGSGVYLRILKRRFRCPSCKKVFTEPIPGVRKGFKTTERYRCGIRWAYENFKDLKSLQKAFGCSAGFVYKTFYEQLALKLRERKNNPWPTRIGIDEHS